MVVFTGFSEFVMTLRSDTLCAFKPPGLPLPGPFTEHLAPGLKNAFNAHKQRCERVARDRQSLDSAQRALEMMRDGAIRLFGRFPRIYLMPIGVDTLAVLALTGEEAHALHIGRNTTSRQDQQAMRQKFAETAVKENCRRAAVQLQKGRNNGVPQFFIDDIVPGVQHLQETQWACMRPWC